MRMRGLDISVWNHDKFPNGELPWLDIRNAGVDFVIIRSGCGRTLAEETFAKDVNDAHSVGLQVGAYHYSYALTPEDAIEEAKFCKKLIYDSGVMLELPVFFDMEDDDKYKERFGFNFSSEHITRLCKEWFENIFPLKSGLYASLHWLNNHIDWLTLVHNYNIPVWNAQYHTSDDFKGWIWQFTNKLSIAGQPWDANILYDDKHRPGLNPWNEFIQS